MNNRKINLKKNFSIAVTVRILIILTGLVSGIFITRYLGPELKGKMSYFMALAGTIWMLLDLGFHKTLPYILVKDNEKHNRIFSFSLLLHLFDLIVLFVIVFIFRKSFYKHLDITNNTVLILFVLFTAITHFGAVIRFFMLAINRVLWENMLRLLHPIFYLLLFFVFRAYIPLNNKYYYILTIMIAPLLLLTYTYTVILFKKEKLKLDFHLKTKEIFDVYKAGIKAFLSSFIIFLLIRFDIFLIKRYEPLSELGIYALAANFVTLLQSFSNLIGSLMLPRFSSDVDDEAGKITILRRVSLLIFLIMFVIAIVFGFFGKEMIGFVYDQAFIRTYDVFMYLIPAVFFLFLGSFLNTYFWSKGFPTITIILPLIALSVNIVLNVILIPAKGIIGAALATSISYFVWFMLLIYYFFSSHFVDKPAMIIWQKSDFVYIYNELRALMIRKRQ